MHQGIEPTVFLWDGSGVKELPQWLNSKVPTSYAGATGDGVQSLCQKGPLEEEMAAHSSTLFRKIPWWPGGHRVTKSQTGLSY